MLPPKDQIKVCFAHVAYRFGERFSLRNTGIGFYEVRGREEMEARIGEADVVVVSGMWKNDLAPKAAKLRFIQSISAGVDQYDKQVLATHKIRLASAQGANANAVSEHGMALILAIARRISEAVQNQGKAFWRGMIGDLTQREDELGGKTLLVVGIGRIGGRLARLAKAFDMRVIGVRRDPSAGAQGADEIHGFDALPTLWGKADVVALTCPLTPQTTGLVNAKALGAMKPGAQLVNLARGKVVDEAALIEAMTSGHLSAAALDVTVEEPLPAESPLWTLPNVLITPHTGGETRRYEDAVIDLLLENLDRLWRGETTLRNQVV